MAVQCMHFLRSGNVVQVEDGLRHPSSKLASFFKVCCRFK